MIAAVRCLPGRAVLATGKSLRTHPHQYQSWGVRPSSVPPGSPFNRRAVVIYYEHQSADAIDEASLAARGGISGLPAHMRALQMRAKGSWRHGSPTTMTGGLPRFSQSWWAIRQRVISAWNCPAADCFNPRCITRSALTIFPPPRAPLHRSLCVVIVVDEDAPVHPIGRIAPAAGSAFDATRGEGIAAETRHRRRGEQGGAVLAGYVRSTDPAEPPRGVFPPQPSPECR